MRPFLIFRLIILVLALGAVIYSIQYLHRRGLNPNYLYLNTTAPKAFTHDDVSHLEWQASSKIFVFDRDRHGNWTPEKTQKTMDGIVEFLSEIQLNQVLQTGKPSLKVVLTVKNEKWVGSWDGLSFVWTEGPHKGQGEILSDKKNLLFFRGKFVFDDVAVDFCDTRANEILLQLDGKNYDLLSSGKGWKLKNAATPVDSVAVEKWLTKLCKIKIKAILDPSYIPSKTTQAAVSLRYVNGTQNNMTQVENDLFLFNQYGLVLEGFKNSLEELKKELLKSTKP